jgi:uncharacterized protein (TIGR03437 family)
MRLQLWAALAAGSVLPAVGLGQIGNIVVTNAASFQEGTPAPGSIGSIFCTGLKVNGVVAATNLPLPTQLAGVSVTVGGAPAPLFAVADLGGYQQINFQVPYTSLFTSVIPVVVAQGGAQGTATSSMGPFDQHGDFFKIAGTQYGVFQHAAGYSTVTEDNPAHPGETIVAYLTGLSGSTNPPPDGYPAPASPLSVVPQANAGGTIDQLGLEIGGIGLWDPAPITGDSTGMSPIPFMGLAPGAVGLYQINFTLPANVAVGDQEVLLVYTNCFSWSVRSFFEPCYAGGGQSYYSQQVLLPVR